MVSINLSNIKRKILGKARESNPGLLGENQEYNTSVPRSPLPSPSRWNLIVSFPCLFIILPQVSNKFIWSSKSTFWLDRTFTQSLRLDVFRRRNFRVTLRSGSFRLRRFRRSFGGFGRTSENRKWSSLEKVLSLGQLYTVAKDSSCIHSLHTVIRGMSICTESRWIYERYTLIQWKRAEQPFNQSCKKDSKCH